jgi:hypothetical protein
MNHDGGCTMRIGKETHLRVHKDGAAMFIGKQEHWVELAKEAPFHRVDEPWEIVKPKVKLDEK